jgi:Mg/Co/Ni transporter MgtE
LGQLYVINSKESSGGPVRRPCGTLSGSMLPFLLRRVGLDPDASCAPFVVTLVDVTGVVIYFTVAHAVYLRHVPASAA